MVLLAGARRTQQNHKYIARFEGGSDEASRFAVFYSCLLNVNTACSVLSIRRTMGCRFAGPTAVPLSDWHEAPVSTPLKRTPGYPACWFSPGLVSWYPRFPFFLWRRYSLYTYISLRRGILTLLLRTSGGEGQGTTNNINQICVSVQE